MMNLISRVSIHPKYILKIQERQVRALEEGAKVFCLTQGSQEKKTLFFVPCSIINIITQWL